MQTVTLRRLTAALAAALTCTLCGIPCAAADPDDDEIILPSDEPEIETYTSGDYEYSVLVNTEDGTSKAAQLEKYTGDDTDVTVPAEIDGYDVLSLGDTLFTENPRIVSVTLPRTVMMIGNYTFSECVNIQKFTVDEDNPTYYSTEEGWLMADEGKLFAWYPANTSAESITLPDGVTKIAPSAFSFTNLKEIVLPDTVTEIGAAAFLHSTLLESVNLPDGITVIPDYAFQDCHALKEITLPDSLTEIGNAAFGATALASVELPETLQTIGKAAFAGTQIVSVTVPATVTEIGECALGYKLSDSYEFILFTGFTVRGYAGSAAQTYCQENGKDMLFVDITPKDEETDESSADGGSQETADGNMSVVRIIGIGVCVVLLIVIAVVAVVTGKKGKSKDA